MITLDQVLMLENKVESAVARIQQLQAENDALRNKCAELTNALSSKSEQLSSFESNQNQIESGILNALDRLNQIENSVLKVTGQTTVAEIKQPEPTVQAAHNPISTEQPLPKEQPIINETKEEIKTVEQNYFQSQQPSFVNPSAVTPKSETVTELLNFNIMEPVMNQQADYPSEQDFEGTEEYDSPDETQDNLGFDIF